MVTTKAKSFVSHIVFQPDYMTSTTTQVALQVHRMGGSGAAGMAILMPKGGGK
jgi:hypothetical protein